MTSILMAMELGGNLGHVSRMVAIADRLRIDGHSILFACPPSGHSFIVDRGYDVVPAPFPARKIDTGEGIASYAEILMAAGYVESRDVASLLDGWKAIVTGNGIDLVVVDHAPTALLACRDAGVPFLSVATGFTLPPSASPMPAFPLAREVRGRRLRKADDHVACVVRGAVNRRLAESIVSVSSIHEGQPVVMATLPELDWYGPRPSLVYAGTINVASAHPRLEWRDTGRPKVFAYIRRGMGGFRKLLTTFGENPWETICVVPGMPSQEVVGSSGGSVAIVGHPVDVPHLLERADLSIGYGGLGSVSEAVLHGVPQLIVPQFDEQVMNAECMERLGAGRRATPEIVRGDLAGAISEVLGNEYMKAGAATFARKHAGLDTAGSVDIVAGMVVEQLAAAMAPMVTKERGTP
jgi:UDP:flavonoid glycosyltransferase YjiC (YdhE family)